ncbi:8000_t:CDS:2 [Racocetra fulgida]|uniref:Dolichyl-diphosphooligosaccharide--protein glycosyltransferase subunit WBP1 n=1 Tax=Racocetra fulgida TaxID=60492 RepID=A0A9N9FI16_9GLOM|nr:8000_t:CDS:2 [Racocetra fulgida]
MAPNSFITPGGLQQRPEVNINESPQTDTLSSNYFTQSWSEWTSLVSQQKPQIPKPPTDSLKLQQYIINSNGWWPVFGGEPKLKRKCDSTTSAFVVSPMSRQTPVSLVPSEFSKRRKIHNCPHFSSQFSCKNYLAVEWDPEENETTTSALPQENFAAVTSRILLVRRLKAKQGNMLKGDAASRFRKNILVKVAQGGVTYGDINTVIESPANDADVIIKRPWRDGTTEPGEGQIFPNATSAHELLEQAREYFRVHKDTSVIDHFNYDMSDDGKHTLIVASGITNNEAILTKNVIKGPPILFRGIAHKVGTVPLLTKILWADETAYSYETKADQQVDQEPLVVGNKIMLVSALQARNNARNFAKDLTKWTFQEQGVLKVTSSRHHKKGEDEELEVYRIKDYITYTIEISEYVNDHWQPFNGTDVQFEAIMLDPYIRKTLTPFPTSPEQQSRKYEAHIQLPDVYGVFTFKVNYKRSGYSYIEDSTVVAIRPFRHNEYPRYISAAYPYYTGAASMIIGFLLFSAVWFFNRENRVKKKTS